MSIKPKYRVLGETNTSIEDPIELTQKGCIGAIRKYGSIIVPTTIKNPKIVTVNPHLTLFASTTAGSALWTELNTAGHPSSGVKLYTAASIYASGYFSAAASKSNFKAGDLIMASDGSYNLYKFKRAYASDGASGVYYSSATLRTALLTKVPNTGSTVCKYIKINGAKALSTTLTKTAFSYEVKGYD